MGSWWLALAGSSSSILLHSSRAGDKAGTGDKRIEGFLDLIEERGEAVCRRPRVDASGGKSPSSNGSHALDMDPDSDPALSSSEAESSAQSSTLRASSCETWT